MHVDLDFSIFTTPEAWISLLTLTFLEVVLGIDNLVFIAITSNRLPENKQYIGRRLGLAAAMVMRCILLCIAAWLVSLTNPLFTIDAIHVHGGPMAISVRDLVLICGGIYLIYKGIAELRDKLKLTEERAEAGHEGAKVKRIGLAHAVLVIMVMDIVFSLDSVFTAVGLSGHILIMVPAVIIAVTVMIVFADPISNFINKHAEMKILALTFIAAIGVLLILEGTGFVTGIELLGMGLENIIVYFAMIFSLVLEFIQMRYNKNLAKLHQDIARQKNAEALETGISMGIASTGKGADSVDPGSEA